MAAALLLFAVALGAGACGSDDPDRPGTTATSGGGAGQGGANQGGGGAGGSGQIPCASAAECPGADDECQTRTCEAGFCGVDHAPANKPVMQQASGDCARNVCDGQGSVISVHDDLDVIDDGDPCTSDLCAEGVPENPVAPAGTPCAVNGGSFCDGAGTCVECLVGGDCPTGACAMNLCVAPTCGDGATNGGESDVDCGGPDCVPCADLLHCFVGSDCQSGVCQQGVCRVPTCFDAVENGQETDTDCGGPLCAGCAPGQGCNQNADCLQDNCVGSVCHTSCVDGVQGGQETDVDCGGPACPGCGPGEACLVGSDCLDGVCTSGACAPPNCGDGAANGSEACDDGNQSNNDGCLNNCTLNVCGDGFLNVGVEPCDDGNQNNTDACLVGCALPSCGDGFVQVGVEACDDGNTAPGDGCSASCALESCGDGVQSGPELCDDGNQDNSDACPNTCVPAACGDGYVWAGVEACDDGNTADSDGCAARCAVEAPYACVGVPSVCTSPSEINCNDGKDNDGDGNPDCADSDCALGCDPAVGGCGPGETLVVYTSSDVPKPILDFLSTSSAVPVGGLGEVSKAAVRLDITHAITGDLDISLAAPGAPSLALAFDRGGFGDHYTNTVFSTGCPPISGGTAPFTGCFAPDEPLTLLNGTSAKGAWALVAADDTAGTTGILNAWGLALCVLPSTCGDGVLDAGEICDDGDSTSLDGCSGACEFEAGWTCGGAPTVCTAVCGDGLVVAGEGCDDANLSAGDGCSPSCAVEAGFICLDAPSDCMLGEVEPNNTIAEADARALDPVSVYIAGDTLYRGSVWPIGDRDYYKLQVNTDSVVRIETFGPVPEDCPQSGFTTQMWLYNAAGAQLYTDFNSGITNCSMITAYLTAGSYYVRVEESGNNAPIPTYHLSVDYIPCMSMEAEVNDTTAQANPLPVGESFCIAGSHLVNADLDMFLLNLPDPGMDVLAEVIEGGAKVCGANGMDSSLDLLSSAGVTLGTDNDDSRGACSMISGSGTFPQDPWAANLAAGDYYLQVWSAVGSAAGQFDYRLVVTVR